MARIPVREPTVGISATPSNQIEPEIYTASGKSIAESAKAMQEIVTSFEEVRDARETAKFQTDLSVALEQTKQTAANDPDYNDLTKYENAINEVTETHLSTITNPMLRSQYREKARLSGYSAYTDIAKIQRKRQVDASTYQSLMAFSTLQKSHSIAMDEVSKQQYKSDASVLVDNMVTAGLTTPEHAMIMKKEIEEGWDKKWQETQTEAYILNNAHLAYSELLKGEASEVFGGMSPVDRAKMMDLAKKRIADTENDVIVATTSREVDIIEQIFAPKQQSYAEPFSLDNLESEVALGKIRPAFAKSVSNHLANAPAVKTNLVTYDTLMRMMRDKSFTNREVYDAIIGAPDVSQTDKKSLIYVKINPEDDMEGTLFDRVLEEEGVDIRSFDKDGGINRANRASTITNRQQALFDAYDGFSSDSDAQRKLVTAVINESQKTKPNYDQYRALIKREAARIRLEKNPEWSRYPKTGQFMRAEVTGALYRVYPDGNIEFIQDRNGDRSRRTE